MPARHATVDVIPESAEELLGRNTITEPQPQPEVQPQPPQTAKRLAIIAAHGTLDAAYPPFILATAAAAMDMDVTIFFTFYGLNLLKKGKIDKLKVAPIANPAMPVPVPNIVGMLPGMTFVATKMMNSWMKKAHVAKLSELLEMAQEMGIKLIACQMTMDLFEYTLKDMIEGPELGGAATYIDVASRCDINLFI